MNNMQEKERGAAGIIKETELGTVKKEAEEKGKVVSGTVAAGNQEVTTVVNSLTG
ncbi:hypothetical protein PF002_g14718 [Phytophthora fragariae]|uniref:Uncharacterized protein n=1 Tax=Phytophthora fragariae TaxID=53985 RepID=A0A6A3YTA4_9STRA|nr:hypothetical protein PF003_g28031 [Phytophthora fragariae]KAE9014785.1 hypothetical protein PF011_g7908 [Phytophthora fragariae]KAE9096647.1 hypothetical protein PF006_g23730 [Phytophthora fragariae]KAE9224348.1 hypothetical protein PF002_g14718 [Phytophthora fragariae]KAE9343585.1 hypothetical protein PF008_g9615 [Phytophthora fragariae]